MLKVVRASLAALDPSPFREVPQSGYRLLHSETKMGRNKHFKIKKFAGLTRRRVGTHENKNRVYARFFYRYACVLLLSQRPLQPLRF
jgi:hypothetical protein